MNTLGLDFWFGGRQEVGLILSNDFEKVKYGVFSLSFSSYTEDESNQFFVSMNSSFGFIERLALFSVHGSFYLNSLYLKTFKIIPEIGYGVIFIFSQPMYSQDVITFSVSLPMSFFDKLIVMA